MLINILKRVNEIDKTGEYWANIKPLLHQQVFVRKEKLHLKETVVLYVEDLTNF